MKYKDESALLGIASLVVSLLGYSLVDSDMIFEAFVCLFVLFMMLVTIMSLQRYN